MKKHIFLPSAAIFVAVLVLGSGASAEPEPGARAGAASIWDSQTLTGDWGGVRKAWEDAGVKFGLNEQGEGWSNLKGGTRAGASANGLATASMTLDLDKLLKWKDAAFFVNAYQIHGLGPSASLVGNQQFISNIEATPATKLYQIWIEQQFYDGRVNIRIGQEGANDEMMIPPSAALFLNSSFGYPDMLAQDLPNGGPNYPMATPMVRTKIKVTDEFTLVNAVFNGDPAGPGTGDPQLRDRWGTAFRLNDPPLIFNELWFERGQDGKSASLPGTYKIGAWVHTGHFNDLAVDRNGLPLALNLAGPRGERGDYAFYAIADQMIWRKGGTKDQGLNLFALAMAGPDSINAGDLFLEGGINWKGMLDGRPGDVFGLAFAYAGTSNALRRYGSDSIALTGNGKRYPSNETVIEVTYSYQVAPWWTIQPDLQYVINPGAALPPTEPGIEAPLRNSLTAGVRSKIEF